MGHLRLVGLTRRLWNVSVASHHQSCGKCVAPRYNRISRAQPRSAGRWEQRASTCHEARSCVVGLRDEHMTDDRTKKEPMNQRLNFAKSAPELYKHVSALDQHIGEHIEHSLFELVKLRASMINGCAFCVDMHSADALKAGETDGPAVRPRRVVGDAAVHAEGAGGTRADRRGHEVRRPWRSRRRVRGGPCRIRRRGLDLSGRGDRDDQLLEPDGDHVPDHAD